MGCACECHKTGVAAGLGPCVRCQLEADVKHWKQQAELKAQQARDEYNLADRLAKALRLFIRWDDAPVSALVAWEKARNDG